MRRGLWQTMAKITKNEKEWRVYDKGFLKCIDLILKKLNPKISRKLQI